MDNFSYLILMWLPLYLSDALWYPKIKTGKTLLSFFAILFTSVLSLATCLISFKPMIIGRLSLDEKGLTGTFGAGSSSVAEG